MSRWRVAFRRIGGPDAVTWPAFWVTYASSLVGHLTTGGNLAAPIWLRVAIVTLAQVVGFVPLLLLRWTVLRNPPWPRPWVAIAGFAASAVVRGLVLASLLVAVGATTQPQWLYRVVSSLQNQMVLLIIVAVVVSAMRAHTRSLEGLIDVQAQLVQAEQRIIEDVTARNEQALAKVQDRLRSELASLQSLEGEESVRELQRLATDVVRTMSHELAASLPSRYQDVPVHSTARVTWQQAALQIIDRPPLQPLAAAAFMALTMTTLALAVYGGATGIPVAVVTVLSVFLTSHLANWALGRALPSAGPRAALAAVAVAGVLVGYTSVSLASAFLPAGQNRALFIAGGGLFVSGIVLLIAAVTTILRQQRQAEHELERSTEQLRRELVRLRQAQWLQQQGLSRALHGPVQSAVTSAALRMDAAVRSGESETALLEDTRRHLLETIDVLDPADAREHSLDLALARTRATWEGLCEISSQVEGEATDRLAADLMAAAVVADVMTEAVSNAVRHGEAHHVLITVSLDDDLLTLAVRDDGRPETAEQMRGLGSTLLDECTLEWTRDITPGGCTLTVVLPTRAAV